MATYEQLKKLVLDEIEPVTSNQRNAVSVRARKEAQAWHGFMRAAVTGDLDLPSDVDTSPIVFSDDRSMFDSIGGGVVLGDEDRHECTATPMRVSASAPDSGWVAVNVDGEVIAMSTQEAFRRGLREVLVPR